MNNAMHGCNGEEAQKLAERLARAKRSVPDLPVQVGTAQDAAIKKAKITVAMSRAQLHKSLKAFGHPPTFDQQSQLIVLQQQFEAAEQALTALELGTAPKEAGTTSNTADLKRAKIQLAMRRVELKKAHDLNASPQQLAEAQHNLDEAQRQVDAHGNT